jgi:predicted RNA binding protein YcfA (HicA-like mRNA interferase family)
MARFLERQGFTLLRTRGSHHYFDRQGVRTTVPIHGNQPLKIGTLRSILRDIDVTPTEFEKLIGG